MALPSSLARNRLQALPLAAGLPTVNVAAVPDQINSSLQSGLQTGQQLSDAIVLRPKQVLAARAQADAAKSGFENQDKANLADRSNIPLRAQLAGTQINTQQTDAENALTLAALKRTVVVSPDFAKEFTAQLTNVAKQGAVESDTSLQNAQGTLGRVPDEQARQNVESDTARQRAQETNDRLVDENAKLRAQAVIDRQHVQDTRDNLLNDSIISATNSDTAKQNAVQLNAITPATNEVAQNAALIARDKSQRALAANSDFQVADADYDKAVAEAVTGAGQAKVAAAPFRNPQVQAGLEEGAQAGAVGQALGAKANLVRLLASIGSGAGTANLDQETQNKILASAAAKGVNVTNKNIQQVSAEYAQKVALEDAAPVLKQIDETSDAAQTSLAALQQIDKLGTVSVGALYGFPGTKSIDGVLAQFGNQDSQKREEFRALAQRLIPLVRQPGAVSNFEQELYAKSVPGPTLSAATNTALVAGLLSIGERNAQRPGFYRSLIGKLPVGDVQQIWDAYTNSNPAILDQNMVNKSALSPQQYLQFLTAAPQQADSQVRELAARQDISTLPVVTDAASLAAAPAYALFVASPNERGQMIAIPNAKYWAPVIAAQKKVQSSGVASGQTLNPQDFQQLFSTPAADFLRPIGTVITPNASAVPSISLLKPLGK